MNGGWPAVCVVTETQWLWPKWLFYWNDKFFFFFFTWNGISCVSLISLFCFLSLITHQFPPTFPFTHHWGATVNDWSMRKVIKGKKPKALCVYIIWLTDLSLHCYHLWSLSCLQVFDEFCFVFQILYFILNFCLGDISMVKILECFYLNDNVKCVAYYILMVRFDFWTR